MRAVFLDRDGVLNENVYYADTAAWESPRTAAEFRLFPHTLPSLQRLHNAGFALFLVSNQPNAAKGKSTMAQLEAIQTSLRSQIDAVGIRFIEFYYCFHHPHGSEAPFAGACGCRKPSPYFLRQAAVHHDVELSRSWMIGDRLSDVACGNQAGVKTVLIGSALTSNGSRIERPHFVADDLAAATALILGCTSSAE